MNGVLAKAFPIDTSNRYGRADRSAVGRWFWEIDRVLLVLVAVLIAIGLVATASFVRVERRAQVHAFPLRRRRARGLQIHIHRPLVRATLEQRAVSQTCCLKYNAAED